MSDPGRLPGLDLLLASLLAQLLGVNVTIASNKVMRAAVWSLILVLTWTETPCSSSSSLLSYLLSSTSSRINSATVLRAAPLVRRWSWRASTAGAWSRRSPGIDPEDQRSLPFDVHPPTILVEHRSWLRPLVIVDTFISDDCLFECDFLLVPRNMLPAPTSSEEVLPIFVSLLQLPQSHVTTANLPIGLLVEVLVWIRRIQPCRAQVAEMRLAPVADPKRLSERESCGGVLRNTYI